MSVKTSQRPGSRLQRADDPGQLDSNPMRQQIPDEQKRLQRIQRLSAKLDAAIASSKGQRKLVEELAREAAALAALYSQATIRLREPKAKQTPRALTPRKSTSDSEG